MTRVRSRGHSPVVGNREQEIYPRDVQEGLDRNPPVVKNFGKTPLSGENF